MACQTKLYCPYLKGLKMMLERREKEESNLVGLPVHLSCRTVPIPITNGTIAPLVVHRATKNWIGSLCRLEIT